MNIENIYKIFKECSGISTDTRKITKDSLFFALKGPNFNANDFAMEALNSGAKYVAVDEERVVKDDRFILTEDVLTTLQQLANYHRRQFNIPFLAITGSNGKTTTKELINSVLSKKYKTYATIGNLNNHIGIPLTILAISEDVELAIIEMGANHQKEIEGYCKIAEPTHGMITNIGKAHLEGFGGIEGVKKGKGELYEYLLKNNGTAFVCSQNETLMGMAAFKSPVLYPQEGDFYHCKFINAEPYVTIETENGEIAETNLIGEYNFENIAAALCIGKFFGVPASDANKGVIEYDPQNNRSQIIQKNSVTLIMDAYNANPTSMKAAINNFAKMEAANKALILGDMFELGGESPEEHKAIGQLLNEKAFGKVILVGKHMLHAAPEVKEAIHFTERKDLEEWLKNNHLKNYHVLIKGSRGMGLEKVVELF